MLLMKLTAPSPSNVVRTLFKKTSFHDSHIFTYKQINPNVLSRFLVGSPITDASTTKANFEPTHSGQKNCHPCSEASGTQYSSEVAIITNNVQSRRSFNLLRLVLVIISMLEQHNTPLYSLHLAEGATAFSSGVCKLWRFHSVSNSA